MVNPTFDSTQAPPSTVPLGKSGLRLVCPARITDGSPISATAYQRLLNPHNPRYEVRPTEENNVRGFALQQERVRPDVHFYDLDRQNLQPRTDNDVYCGDKDYVMYATLYNMCYGTNLEPETIYKYTRIGEPGLCFNKGKRVGPVLLEVGRGQRASTTRAVQQPIEQQQQSSDSR